MEKPKNWKAGNADAAWKVMICSRDAARVQDITECLADILGNPISPSLEDCANVLRDFTGEQIADALMDYYKKSFDSVANALPPPT